MRNKLFTLIFTAMTITNSLNAQQLDFSKVKTFEHQLDDVMENPVSYPAQTLWLLISKNYIYHSGHTQKYCQ